MCLLLFRRARLEPPVSDTPPPTCSREYAVPTTPELHYHYVTTPHLQLEHQVCHFKTDCNVLFLQILEKIICRLVQNSDTYMNDVDIGPAGSTYFRYRYRKRAHI